MSTDDADEQLAFIRDTVRRAKPRTWRGALLADELPVARVVVDKGLLSLDKFFDYAVPANLAEEAQPGVRVRVRFGARVGAGGRREGGELYDGFVVARLATSDFPGVLAPLAQVLSPERVLTPALLTLCRTVADRYAGSLADVLQLAVPPRHAKAEAEPSPEPLPPPGFPAVGSWDRYVDGAEYLTALADGRAPRAVWTALPGPTWPEEIARAVAATLAGGRGALVVLPEGRSVARVDAALTELLGEGRHAALAADLGPKERYRRWLSVSRGSVRAAIGTRAAMFAPVRDLGLVVVWNDGDGSHSDQRAPHPHVREVALLRAAEEGAGVLLGGLSVTVEGAQLLRTGWARPLAAARETVRAVAPRVRTVTDLDQGRDAAAQYARLPRPAWEAARDALTRGPVLIQVPRRGYAPRLACAQCRTPARCRHCEGPLAAGAAGAVLECAWCGTAEPEWHCVECGSFRLRAQVVGAKRTAEELGKAFPRVPVRTSGRDSVLSEVSGEPALVISTPGAEPVAEGGYAAALLLDGWALLGRPDLRAGEEALRLWMTAAGLVRPAAEGGTVVVVAEPTARPVQALVRWDPAGHAAVELEERAQLHFPPVSRMASVTGAPQAVEDLLSLIRLPEGADVLGPVPAPGGRGQEWERALLRVAPGQGAVLAAALKAAQIARVALRSPDQVRIRIDPPDIG
ncbi:primosomal protein N' (replication factor Y) [Kitasatospora gansuensis]|uniref:Probable replication restart protein PriA n=1 Tax=Kitasatospora gansuensis TaxID=258050 RepID=A0A7W7S7H8_9ACTN|nr:primosomal protein N' [Kitasatospora gansuensis]MBB4945279.1 primosomal protein N' (replication factor Y) [Kitasatospora gansuensis]